MKIWHALEIEIDRVAETPITTQLWNANTTGLEISEENPTQLILRAYFEVPPDIEKINDQMNRALRLCDLPEATLHSIKLLTINDQDWLAEWKKGYEPVSVGERLLICPSWKRDQISASDRIVIQIDPGMAFGTGTHETTRGCLELLEKVWHGGAFLDVGTGTGILAIAAIKLFPEANIIGFDIDPEAIDVAVENAEINQVGDYIQLEVNKLSSFADQTFDVVVANLTADVIIPLAKELHTVVKPGGFLIVSGILKEQAEEVLNELHKQQLILLESKPDGEWISFALQSEK